MTTLGKDTPNPTSTVPNDMYVKLISSDEHEFYLKRDLALTSQTIKAMLSGPGLSFVLCDHFLYDEINYMFFFFFFQDNMQRMKQMLFIFEVSVHR